MENTKVEGPSAVIDSASSDSGFMQNHFGYGSIAGSSKAGSVCSDDIDDKISSDDVEDNSYLITKEMIKEEKKLSILADEEMEKLQKKLEIEEYNKEMELKKYQRLQNLLKKSQFYSSFASSKLDQLKNKKLGKTKAKKRKAIDHENTPSKAARKGNTVSDSQRVLTEINSKRNADFKEKGGEKTESTVKQSDVVETRVTTLGVTVPSSQPQLLVGGALRDYQLEGLDWLKTLFLGGMNGILADEMGLGKTIQIISFICHLYEEGVGGPFLIVAPLSTLPNWLQEFQTFAPDVPVVLYHGNKNTRNGLHRDVKKAQKIFGVPSKPVIITSFEIPIMDKYFLGSISWKYIIVDEGHRLKNHNTLLSKVLKSFSSINRMLLTGTPLQNNLNELWSLLHFLMPEVFNDFNDFHALFVPQEIEQLASADQILQKEKENHIISTLHKILEPFLLRRVKSDVNLNLPPKQEKFIYCPLTDIQYKLYSLAVNKSIIKLTENYNPEKELLVIPDNPDGTRARRKTRSNISYKDFFNESDLKIVSETCEGNDSSSNKEIEEAEEMDSLIISANMNDEDCFKFRITMNNIMVMLRKISNHPYLVHKLVYPGSDMLRVDERIVTCSGKMMILDSLLRRLKEGKHKVLIFSTFTMVLDLIEEYMEMREYTYVRLDGNTKIEDRKEYIKLFNTDPDIFVFLVSTRAGGLGINLTAADTVIIYDSDWNPQVDLQAQDRCHRIGQTKPVLVFRLISTGTIDENIVSRAQAKRKLEKVVIQAGEFKYRKPLQNKLQLDLEYLRSMIDEKNHSSEIHSNASVLTDEQWEKLLDRKF